MSEDTFNPDDILQGPLTRAQILERRQENGFVSGLILVDLSDAIDNDLDGFLDEISERLVGTTIGMEIDYEAVGVLRGSIVMRVSLDPAAVLDDEEQDEDLTNS